jgi:hypothetical protein
MENVILFHEHTWGAFKQYYGTGPPCGRSVESKKQFSADGSFLSEKLEKELLLPLTDPASKTIAVFNTSSWQEKV